MMLRRVGKGVDKGMPTNVTVAIPTYNMADFSLPFEVGYGGLESYSHRHCECVVGTSDNNQGELLRAALFTFSSVRKRFTTSS